MNIPDYSCYNCFHRHQKLSSRMSVINKEPSTASPESQLCCLHKAGREPDCPLCAGKVWAGGLPARHDLRKGVYPCSACEHHCGANYGKSSGWEMTKKQNQFLWNVKSLKTCSHITAATTTTTEKRNTAFSLTTAQISAATEGRSL